MDNITGWHPKYIVLDSTELIRDINMESPSIALLRAYCAKFGAEVAIPRVVLLEVEEKIESRLAQAAASARKAAQHLHNAGARVPDLLSDIGLEQLTLRAKTDLKRRLEWLRYTELPLPDVDHEQVITRILDRRRPFRTDAPSDHGYRDYLIWASVLTLDEPTAFVTENKGDFGGEQEDAATLHPHLAEDTLANNGDIRLFLGLSSLTDNVIRPRFPTIDVADLLVDFSSNKRRLERFAEDNLQDHILTQAAEQYLDALDGATEAGRAVAGRGDLDSDRMRGWIQGLTIGSVTKGTRLDDTQTVSFTCSAEARINLRFFSRIRDRERFIPSNRLRGRLSAEFEFSVDFDGEKITPMAVSLRSLSFEPALRMMSPHPQFSLPITHEPSMR